MFKEAVTFPTKGDSAVKTLLIGGVLSLLNIFIIPGIFVQGYLVKEYQATIDGDDEPPTFSNWGELFGKGLEVVVLNIAYLIVPTVILIWSIFSASFGATTTNGMATSTGASSGMMAKLAVTGILFLIVVYILPAAVANYAREDKLGAAFSFGTIKDVALSGDYFVGWLMVITLSIPFMVVSLPLTFIPPLQLLIGPFLTFIMQIMAIYIFGRSYAKALDLDVESGGSGSTGAEVPA